MEQERDSERSQRLSALSWKIHEKGYDDSSYTGDEWEPTSESVRTPAFSPTPGYATSCCVLRCMTSWHVGRQFHPAT